MAIKELKAMLSLSWITDSVGFYPDVLFGNKIMEVHYIYGTEKREISFFFNCQNSHDRLWILSVFAEPQRQTTFLKYMHQSSMFPDIPNNIAAHTLNVW